MIKVYQSSPSLNKVFTSYNRDRDTTLYVCENGNDKDDNLIDEYPVFHPKTGDQDSISPPKAEFVDSPNFSDSINPCSRYRNREAE